MNKFIIIIAIVELLAILYYKKRCKIAEDYCEKCRETINEMLGFVDSELKNIEILINQEIKEKGENNNESN